MREIRHPLSGAVYGLDGDLVRVDKSDGVGWFDENGRWVRGEVRSADPELCRWIIKRATQTKATR